jgi:septum formation protein
MPSKTARLILGSASPRRRDLLKQIGITPDEISAADLDETPKPRELPAPYVLRVANEKNAAVAAKFPDAFVVTADTTVALGRRIIGKAADKKEAEKILHLLSGRAHNVITAVVIRAPNGKIAHRSHTTRVKVKRLSDTEIRNFLETDEWKDTAGAYKFQMRFMQYITHIDGQPSCIVGLPLYETAAMLRGLGYDF